MKKSFRIYLDSNFTEYAKRNLEQFFEELTKYNGVEIDKKKMEITYDTSVESEVGKLLDKYMLKSQDNE